MVDSPFQNSNKSWPDTVLDKAGGTAHLCSVLHYWEDGVFSPSYCTVHILTQLEIGGDNKQLLTYIMHDLGQTNYLPDLDPLTLFFNTAG